MGFSPCCWRCTERASRFTKAATYLDGTRAMSVVAEYQGSIHSLKMNFQQWPRSVRLALVHILVLREPLRLLDPSSVGGCKQIIAVRKFDFGISDVRLPGDADVTSGQPGALDTHTRRK